jgi:hypothetical protein
LFLWLPLSQAASVGIRAQVSFHGSSHKKKGQLLCKLSTRMDDARNQFMKNKGRLEGHEEVQAAMRAQIEDLTNQLAELRLYDRH